MKAIFLGQTRITISRCAGVEDEADEGECDIGLSMTILGARRARKPASEGRVVLRHEPLIWVAGADFVAPPQQPLPLVALPESCSLRRMMVRTLESRNIPCTIAHSASGVGGLHLALAAGLGVTCLNASAVPGRAAANPIPLRLPALPEADFSLVPPRAGEPSLVADVRIMLARELGQHGRLTTASPL